jgi:hypothetical protein
LDFGRASAVSYRQGNQNPKAAKINNSEQRKAENEKRKRKKKKRNIETCGSPVDRHILGWVGSLPRGEKKMM